MQAFASSLVKEKITITIPKDLLDWIDEMVRKHIYSDRSHAFTYGIARLKEEYEASQKAESASKTR